MFKIFTVLSVVVTVVFGTCHDHSLDCQIEYGAWSLCDPCTKIQSRHINVTAPAHLNGATCPGDLEEHQSCVPTTSCPAKEPCAGQFDCGSAHCIDSVLVCNGDDDCGNGNDERSCSPTMAFPKVINDCLNLERLPYLDHVSSGINLATGDLMGRTLDHQRFNGFCRKVYDGDAKTTYRLPYNMDNFNFEVTTSDDLQVKNFDSVASLTKELDTSSDFSITAGLGFSIDAFSFDSSVTYTNSKTFKDIHSTATAQKSQIFRLHANVELAQFQGSDAEFLLDQYFVRLIERLPKDYNPKLYYDIFSQYGTHYLKSGSLGGKYEHYYVFKSDDLEKSGHTVSTASHCLKTHMKAGLFSFSASEDSSSCTDSSHSLVSSSSVVNMASKKVVNIRGGTSAVAGRLAAGDLTNNGTEDSSKFEAWVNSVRQNPSLIKKEVRSVCELIRSANVTESDAKYSNCVTATNAYLAPYSRVNCRQCKNGGFPININKVCTCACPFGYGGDQCDFRFPKAGQAYVDTVSGPTPLTSFASSSNSQHSGSMVKFLVTGTPPKATNPPHLSLTEAHVNDVLMKAKGSSVYLLASDTGVYVNMQGQDPGGYTVKEFDENLKLLSTTPLVITSLVEANSMCNINDFDLDGNNNYVISLQCYSIVTGIRTTNIYTIDAKGSVQLTIPTPCQASDADKEISYVSLTCQDQVIVTCPGTPGTVRVFSAAGKPERVTQFAGYDPLNSVQVFNGQVWVHSNSRQIASYDLSTWQQVYNYTGTPFGTSLAYTQLFVDFAGNVVAAQSHNSEPNKGKQNEKFLVLDGTKDRTVLASTILEDWNMCTSTVAINGKLFVQCHNAEDDSKAYIFAYDYLV